MSEAKLTADEKKKIRELATLVEEERYYELLSVEKDCLLDEVRRSYHNMSRKWHPDRFFRRDVGEMRETIESIFMGVTRAYRVLTSEVDRKQYDFTHSTPAKKSDQKSARSKTHHRGARRRKRARTKTSSTAATTKASTQSARKAKKTSKSANKT